MPPLTVKRGDLEIVATDEEGLRVILRVLGLTVPPSQLDLMANQAQAAEATARSPHRKIQVPPPLIEHPTADHLRRAYQVLDGNARKIVAELHSAPGEVVADSLAKAIGSDRLLSVAGTLTTISRRVRKLGVPIGAMIESRQGMVDGKFKHRYRLTPLMREVLDSLKKAA
ncbi:MAG: hypothetical protein HY735_12900 [Verrucomicrobia bacterium]|nr:hypothetical protein [Verrucomicrobiota bacterium]